MGAYDSPIDHPTVLATAPRAGRTVDDASSRRSRVVRAAVTAMVMATVTLCTPALAQWKWLDANGNAQYSDRPPPLGTPDSKVLLRPNANARPMAAAPAPASTASGPVRMTTDPELEARRKKAEADAKEQADAKAKAENDRIAKSKADNCTRARSQAATLNDGIRIARVNANGEREYLDDKQRADESKRAQSIMASDCNP
ncbi:MAG: transrane protein [Rhizobacter sp.]|nr:transrane protein [Rhizobacter sp.]